MSLIICVWEENGALLHIVEKPEGYGCSCDCQLYANKLTLGLKSEWLRVTELTVKDNKLHRFRWQNERLRVTVMTVKGYKADR